MSAVLTETTGTGPLVSELIDTGACTKGCLSARTTRCSCPCGGAWHGAVLATRIQDGWEPSRSGKLMTSGPTGLVHG